MVALISNCLEKNLPRIETETIEIGRGRERVGAHILPDDPVTLLCITGEVIFFVNYIAPITGRAEDGHWDRVSGPSHDLPDLGLGMIEQDAIERTI